MDNYNTSKTSLELDGSLYDSALEDNSEYYSPRSDMINETSSIQAASSNHSHQESLSSLNIMDLNNSSLETFNNLEVDPKSNLANKTIFKTDNPNLSIIEINDNDNLSKSTEESVLLVELDDINELGDKQNNNELNNKEKFRSILQQSTTSKQKLNINTKNTNTSGASTLSSGSSSSIVSSAGTSSANVTTTTESRNELENVQVSPERRVIRVYNTIDEFEKNLPQTVKILNTPYGSKVYLIGTAHFSEESQDDVSFVIRNVQPDVVVVELCTSRIHILKHDEKSLLEETKNFNFAKIRDIIRTNGAVNGIFYILLLHMSAKIAKDIGMAPGGEFRRAFEEIQNLSNCTLYLGDRPISITLKRALRALSFWQTLKLVWKLSYTDKINVEDVEECKQSDLLEQILQEIAGEFPEFSDVFVRERDLYLCQSLQTATIPTVQPDGSQRPVKVVGVVGIGHTSGIIRNWLHVDPSVITKILEIPPPRLSTQLISCTIKIGIFTLIAYGFMKYVRPK